MGRRDPASIGRFRLAVGAPRERDAFAQRATDQPIASHATLGPAVPLDLHGDAASRQQRTCPPLQVGAQQGFGPVELGLATLDHAEAKALPTLADTARFIHDFEVVNQRSPCSDRSRALTRMDTAPGTTPGEPIDSDRQDDRLGDASLDRVDRRIPRGGIADTSSSARSLGTTLPAVAAISASHASTAAADNPSDAESAPLEEKVP